MFLKVVTLYAVSLLVWFMTERKKETERERERKRRFRIGLLAHYCHKLLMSVLHHLIY